jgi:hypothetical protein
MPRKLRLAFKSVNFAPVRTVEDLDSLDEAQVVEGYLSAERGDPEPGPNRGRSFWHGWRNRMMDLGALEHDRAARDLAREYVARQREKV